MSASKMPQVHLRVTGPDGLSKDVLLGQDNAIVGSGPSATIRLLDAKVSAVHFLLKLSKSGELSILDLGSEAGTKLKGAAIKEPTVLTSGDTIEVGSSTLRVTIGDGASEGTEVLSIAAQHEPTDEEEIVDATADVQTESEVRTANARLSTVRARALISEEGAESTPTTVMDDAGRVDRTVPDRATPVGRVAATALSLAAAPQGRRKDRPLSSFQGGHASAFALGPNGNKLLNEEFAADDAPTEANRVLEVALLWGDTIIDVRSFSAGQTIKIGPGADSDFRVYEDGIGQSFSLITNGTVQTPPGAKLAVYRDGRESKAGESAQLALGERALVTLDSTRFIVRWIRPAVQSKTGFFDSVDFYFTKVLSVAFMAHLVLLVGFWITPLNNDLLSEDLFKNPSALVKTIIKEPEKKKKFDLSGVKEGAKAKDKEGKFGKKEAKKPEAAPSKKGAPIVDAKKREEDRKKIMTSGLLAGLKGPEGAVSNVFGPGGLGTGLNNALGGLQGGAGNGDAHGVGGLGSRGAGPGGGGTALGIGGLGTKGNGHGRGGYGNIDLGGRGKGDTRIIPGKTNVVGSLSKDVIAAIIRKHQNEIKYCYELELNKHPDLNGKISVAFTIDGTGDVSEANVNETTMGNSNVENCMATKIRRWKFPEPKGGGQVFVTYPWVFKASGSEE